MKQLIAITIAPLLFIMACATPMTTAYKTIGSCAVSVDAAMSGWGDYVKAKNVSVQDQAPVKAAYEKYQQAMRTAKVAIYAYEINGVEKSAVETAINILDASKNELIDLILILKR